MATSAEASVQTVPTLDFEPSPEHLEFLDSFRRFCDREIGPVAASVDEAQEIPTSHYRKLGEVGFLGLLHEERYGGQDAGLVLATLAQTVLAEYCGSTFFSAGASAGLFGGPIADFGTPEQKQKYLPAIIKGAELGALAVTEPGAGSDVSALTTRVEERADGLILNGQKTFITNAPVARYAVVLARYVDKDGSDRGLTHFIVDLSLPGVSRGRPMKKMGLRASPTGELFFEDVQLGKENILGRPGRGFRQTMLTFSRERLALAAYSVGVMAACLADSRRYSKERRAFGKPIGKHQSVAFMLADILTGYQASRLLLLETAWLMEEARLTEASGLEHNGEWVDLAARAATVKLLASTQAREATNLAVQIHGGAGYIEEFRVCRLYRDIKIAEIGGGTSEIQKGIIARAEIKRVR